MIRVKGIPLQAMPFMRTLVDHITLLHVRIPIDNSSIKLSHADRSSLASVGANK